MPYQKRLQKTYGSIESQVQPGSSYSNGGVGDGGVVGDPSKHNLSNNNNNVSFKISIRLLNCSKNSCLMYYDNFEILSSQMLF